MLRLERAGAIGTITLDRPAIHNAFNDELISKITLAIEELGGDSAVRVVVFRANGPSFSAGGDLNWMQRARTYTAEENLRDARAGANMFLAVTQCPKPVIARVHARALGGGSGLVACCDMAVAVESAEFGLPEVKIGLLPGIIGPFSLQSVVTVDLDLIVYDVSLRVPGNPILATTSPYTKYKYGETFGVGRRIAKEIRRGLENSIDLRKLVS